jgi:hypothetical protein
VHPEDEIEEALLIAAFRRRQYIEVAKVQALITAAVNPSKASEAYKAYLKMMMPEYEEFEKMANQRTMDIFNLEKDLVFELASGHNGWSAQQVRANKE